MAYLEVKPHTLLLYGYTYDRKDVFIYFNDKRQLVREDGNPCNSVIFTDGDSYLYDCCIKDVKRYYPNCVNRKLKDLFSCFGVKLPITNSDAVKYYVGMEI